jgi:hypothetical protein
MKTIRALIGLSVVTNVVLLIALGLRLISDSASTPIVTPTTTVAKSAPAAAPLDPAAWAALQTADLSLQARRLQAEGFPPEVIRALLAARISAQFANRRKAMEAGADFPFWMPSRDPKTEAALRALDREEEKTLRELLGPDPENGRLAAVQRKLPGISPVKLAQAVDIDDKYELQRSQLSGNGRGVITAEDKTKLAALEQARLAEMATVFTAAELEEYNLRFSRSASQVQFTLTAFDATEDEYRTLVRLRQPYEAQLSGFDPAQGREAIDAYNKTLAEIKEQTKAALGPERFKEYERATDFNFRRTSQLVSRLNLPAATAVEVYQLQQDIQQRASEARRLPPTERSAQLANLVTEAETQLAAKLGPQGLTAYKQYSGSWLNNLTPRPPTPPPK